MPSVYSALAASGFRDFTRIAGSHPEMWRDISLANRDALLADLHRYQAALTSLTHALENCDGAALVAQLNVLATSAPNGNINGVNRRCLPSNATQGTMTRFLS